MDRREFLKRLGVFTAGLLVSRNIVFDDSFVSSIIFDDGSLLDWNHYKDYSLEEMLEEMADCINKLSQSEHEFYWIMHPQLYKEFIDLYPLAMVT